MIIIVLILLYYYKTIEEMVLDLIDNAYHKKQKKKELIKLTSEMLYLEDIGKQEEANKIHDKILILIQ